MIKFGKLKVVIVIAVLGHSLFVSSGKSRHSCSPVDCVWGEWDSWSCTATCGQTGSKFRNRTWLVTASCGGTQCVGNSSELAGNCAKPCKSGSVVTSDTSETSNVSSTPNPTTKQPFITTPMPSAKGESSTKWSFIWT